MTTTSPEVKAALETIFAADSEFYEGRGFQRRIGYGTRPALLVIDMANAWTRPNHAFTCDNMEEIIPPRRPARGGPREAHSRHFHHHCLPGPHRASLGHRPVAPENPGGDPAGRLGGGQYRRPPGPAARRAGHRQEAGQRLSRHVPCRIPALAEGGHGHHHRGDDGGCVRHSTEDAHRRRVPAHRGARGGGRPGARVVEWNLFDIDAKFGDVSRWRACSRT